MRKQFVVAMKDLRYATLACSHCNTKVTIDLAFESRSPERANVLAPSTCPRCRAAFDSSVPAAVDAMQGAYRALVRLGDAVTFTGETEPQDRE